MAIKKSELYSSLWASCDELRGGMDASQYKDYVLFMLFIKYISDKYADSDDFAPPVTIPAGASFKDMVRLKGKSDIGDKINTQIIQPLIDNNARLARSDFPDFNDPNKLGEGKAMVDRLTNLVSIFQKPELNFSKNRADHDDILGDAYEYLMRHFASESGKSKGQFYTPSEVSRIIAKVIGISPQNAVASTTAYDPTCGSGSLLLKVAAEAGKHITLEGQEKDVTTAGLARMNMILHDFPTANILNGNTLASPKFKDGESLRTYDFVVANPPFSDKTWSTGLTPSADPYQRFEWGEPPAKQGDYAYLLHIIRSMKSAGKAACILPHGVLFRGNAEAVIRKRLVRSGYLKGIIGLPANLFYGTGIPACILVLDKENAPARKGVFMIDASKGFIKDGNKNRLREQDIHKIVDTFTKQTDTPRYARMVPFDEIADPRNAYNLNLPRYIDSTEPEDIQDIDGHLRGGIPDRDIDALDKYWQVIPGVRQALFESAGRPGYSRLRLPIAKVKSGILDHSEFATFKATVSQIFEQWRTTNTPALKGFNKEGHPKALIETIAEDLLTSFRNAPLLDAYDIYQHLMDYWAEAMQDDCYLIAADGWVAKTHRVMEEVKSGKKKGEMKDKGWACDLIPKPYMVARYFAKEQAELDALQAELDAVSASLTELAEEYGGEEGALKDVSNKGDALEAYTQVLVAVWNEEDKTASRAYSALMDQAEEHAAQIRILTDHHFISALKNNKGNLTLKAVKDRLAATSDPKESATLTSYLEADKSQKAATKQASELLAKVEKQYQKRLKADPLPENLVDLHATVRYLNLLDEQSALKRKVKEADAALDQLAYDKYPQLSVDEIKTLVVDDKWLATIAIALQSELDRVSQTLTTRIRQLAERYDTPLPKLVDEVTDLSARVDEHLKRMGAVWN
ncbi:HsdM family class I SAM-dependent methyltransferase [Woeseia oceani]|uniref:site-specific DNA-methyltransferase (adenine-specific) n=1 Tax=Woeseia oceani TaxID=1548547 RepID=A0A193LEL6_9GAMM|nr:class I SAM-dependent DNA methyltransferase [Woeseia oceani]ANO50824.1 type I restriction endonuclease subunit M [Woeseia oceani]